MTFWQQIHKSARDNCIREYLRHQGHDENSRWLRSYYRRRALANAKEWRALVSTAEPQEVRYERAA